VSPTPECHGFAPSRMQQPVMRKAYLVKRPKGSSETKTE
jgi:hypothetical protein